MTLTQPAKDEVLKLARLGGGGAKEASELLLEAGVIVVFLQGGPDPSWLLHQPQALLLGAGFTLHWVREQQVE